MHRRKFVATLPLLPVLAGRAAGAQDLTEIKVGGIQLPTNAPLFIAMEKNYFAQEGLKVEPTWFTAAATVFSAVVSRDIDIGITAITAATFNLAARGGFRIIGGTTREEPGFHINAFLVSNKAFAAGFTALKDMAGKRIGMTTAGSTHQYYVDLFARKYGVDPRAIALVPLESYANIIAALKTGQIDGAVLPAIPAQRLLDGHDAHLITWAGDEVPWQQGVIFASPATLAGKHDLVVRFMRAFARGAAEYHRNFNELTPDGKIARGGDYDALATLIARDAGIKRGELDGQVPFIDAQARYDQPDIMRQVAFWQEQSLVTKGFDFSKIFDPSFLTPAGK
jgi:NitT/TauT family transport system substrate-binding protein